MPQLYIAQQSDTILVYKPLSTLSIAGASNICFLVALANHFLPSSC